MAFIIHLFSRDVTPEDDVQSRASPRMQNKPRGINLNQLKQSIANYPNPLNAMSTLNSQPKARKSYTGIKFSNLTD